MKATVFGIANVDVSPEGVITFADVPFTDVEEMSDLLGDEVVRCGPSTLGSARCDLCRRRIEFPVDKATQLVLPWRPLGWLIAWNEARDRIVVLCSRHMVRP